jgi:hypothetical protein
MDESLNGQRMKNGWVDEWTDELMNESIDEWIEGLCK